MNHLFSKWVFAIEKKLMKKLEVNFMYYVLRNRVKKLEKEVEELKKIIKELIKEKEDENIILETRGNDIVASTD